MVSKLTNQIEEGLEKRKQLENPLGITYRDFRFSYSLDYLGKVFNLLSELCSLQNSFDEMDSFAKNCFLRENAIDELELIFREHFIPLKRESVFASWVYEKEDSNAYFIEAYKQLLGGKRKAPRNVQELNRVYEEVVFKRNVAFHRKNIKRFHLFRTDALSLNETTNFLPDYLGSSSEAEIIQEISFTLQLLDSSFDVFTKMSLVFFFFLYSMPYYNENFFLCKYVLSTYLFEKNYSLLALTLGQLIERNKQELETRLSKILKEGHGDLSDFVSFCADFFHDGISSLSFELAKKKYTCLKNSQPKDKNDEKLKYFLSLGSIFTSYGLNIFEIEEETKISIPTINRYLKKMREGGCLNQKRIGKREFFSLK